MSAGALSVLRKATSKILDELDKKKTPRWKTAADELRHRAASAEEVRRLIDGRAAKIPELARLNDALRQPVALLARTLLADRKAVGIRPKATPQELRQALDQVSEMYEPESIVREILSRLEDNETNIEDLESALYETPLWLEPKDAWLVALRDGAEVANLDIEVVLAESQE
ncbi:MAG: hypothetical protein JST54_12140 [Deltaproteobacteria bacterium]|nr:hypothetical protein [Deltaproteobacteria bacterium]